MAELGPKNKHKVSAKSLANLRLLAESRKRYSQPVQQIEARSSRKMTAEHAKAYLTADGGDKDKVREAARKDGWEF
jgi:hypothetical protein